MSSYEKMVNELFKGMIKDIKAVDVDSNIESNSEFDAEIEVNGTIIRFDNVDDLIKFTKEMAVIKL